MYVAFVDEKGGSGSDVEDEGVGAVTTTEGAFSGVAGPTLTTLEVVIVAASA